MPKTPLIHTVILSARFSNKNSGYLFAKLPAVVRPLTLPKCGRQTDRAPRASVGVWCTLGAFAASCMCSPAKEGESVSVCVCVWERKRDRER